MLFQCHWSQGFLNHFWLLLLLSDVPSMLPHITSHWQPIRGQIDAMVQQRQQGVVENPLTSGEGMELNLKGKYVIDFLLFNIEL